MPFLILIMMTVPYLAKANPILVSSPELTLYQSKSVHSGAKGVDYAEWLIKKLRLEAEAKTLLESAIQLRQHEINNNNEAIYKVCNNIFEARHSSDWGPDERSLIRRCLKHLIHFSADARKKLALKHEAQAFKIPDLNLSESIPKKIRENFNWILINGHAYSSFNNKVVLPVTSFRATLISNRFIHQSEILTAEEFRSYKPKTQPLVSGTCDTRFRYEGKMLSSLALRNTQVLARACSQSLQQSPSIEVTFKMKPQKEFRIPKWVWWTAAGVLGYNLYKEQNKKDSSRPARRTTKRGF